MATLPGSSWQPCSLGSSPHALLCPALLGGVNTNLHSQVRLPLRLLPGPRLSWAWGMHLQWDVGKQLVWAEWKPWEMQAGLQ